MKTEYKSLYNEVSSDGIKKISGFAAVYNNIDAAGDIILPGAFNKAIEEHKQRPLNLYHSHSDIANMHLKAEDIVGTITLLEEREINGVFGLYYEAVISQAPSSQDVAIKASEGHLRECSIGYAVVRDAFGTTESGKRVRLLKELKLREISLVGRACNEKAVVMEVKEEPKEEEEQKQETIIEEKQEVKMSEEKNISNEEVKAMLEEIKSLKINQAKMEKELDASARLPRVEEEVKEEKKEEEVKEEIVSEEVKAEQELNSFAKIFEAKGNIFKQEEAMNEYKALRTNVDADGGLAAPAKLVEKIKEKKQQINRIQNRVLRQPVNGAINLLDFDFSESFPAHTENGASTVEDIQNAFGSSLLDPQDFSVIVKLSDRLKRRSIVDMTGFLANRYVKYSENLLEEHIMTGDGDQKPIGITTFMDNVNSANKEKSVTGGTIVAKLTATIMRALEMTLDEEYRSGAELYCSKLAIREMKLIKNGAGNFIWQDSLIPGQPATFMGYPVYESKSLESGSAAGDQPIIFCDPSEYMLAIEEEFNTEILNEYRSSNQTGLKFHRAYAGAPLDKNAFASLEVQS